jgi:hypothetical protein
MYTVSVTSPSTRLQCESYAFQPSTAKSREAIGVESTHVELALQLAVAAQLHEDGLVEAEAHEVEGLGGAARVGAGGGHGLGLLGFCVLESGLGDDTATARSGMAAEADYVSGALEAGCGAVACVWLLCGGAGASSYDGMEP